MGTWFMIIIWVVQTGKQVIGTSVISYVVRYRIDVDARRVCAHSTSIKRYGERIRN